MENRRLFHIFYLSFSAIIFSLSFEIICNKSFNTLEYIYVGGLQALIAMMAGNHHFYNKSYKTISNVSLSVQIVVFIVLSILAALHMVDFPNWPTFLMATLLATTCTYLFNYVALFLYRKMFGGQRLCVIGNEEDVLKSIENLMKIENMIFSVTHAFTCEFFSNIEQYITDFDAVYFASEVEIDREKIYYLLLENNKGIYNGVNFQSGLEVMPSYFQFGNDVFIGLKPYKLTKVEEILKRVFDIFLSLLLLFLTLPLMILISIAIKFDSKGPVFYSQVRVTMNGRLFKVVKFRSMVQNAEIQSGPVFASSNDSRVTRLGKFLRFTRLDELPQLFNILKGDMSIVGPRPERPHFVEQFEKQSPCYHLRHRVRAGLTGYAQIYGTYNSDFNSKLKYDLLYIQRYSFYFDIKLILRTLNILFDKLSSKGIDENEENKIVNLKQLEKFSIVVK
ncbi:exopolysaccharide biosynthesis polyprenyl glycosylphosphotransferase [Streptococcus suis]|nr:exopolysaccharide biosynthesis polyprenyl glycosylphosphotransferase [Streptococcus suis]